MPRYVTRGWQDEAGWGWQERPTATVLEAERGPVDTGLLDQHGVRIFRVEDRAPLGFDLSKPRYRVKAGSAPRG